MSGLRSTPRSSPRRRRTRRAKKNRFPSHDKVTFLNGHILTLDSRRPFAQALTVECGRIAGVGTNHQILADISRDAEILDLRGATVLPGFTDCHTHLVAYGLELSHANLRSARSILEIQTILARQARKPDSGKWLLGYGWDQEKLKERRFPGRLDLDDVVSDKPVCIFRICEHMCVVNSEALRLANITASSSSPAGGIIDRDEATGEPTGLLKENAMDLVTSMIPVSTDQDVRKATHLAMDEAVSVGLTAVHCVLDRPQHLRVLHAMNRDSELRLRVYALIPDAWLASAAEMGISTGFGDDMLKIQAVKIFTDGSLGARTAALESPYSDAPDTSGVLIHPQDELNRIIESAARHGLQVAIHVIGDRAVSAALTAIENAIVAVPKFSKLRPRIEHVSVLDRKLIKRIKRSKVIASVQPHFVVSDVWVPERVGQERAGLVYPLRSLARNAAMVVGGSDCPVEPIDPLTGIYAAVASSGHGEQVDVQTAIEMYTRNAAYATFEERAKGKIQAGMIADLVVLDHDPLRVSAEEISKIKVLATMVGGRFVYVSKRFQARRASSEQGQRVPRYQ